MVAVHQRLGVALVAIVAVGAIMALVGALRGGSPPMLRAFARLSSAALGVQVLIGLVLLATGHRAAESLHYVYGGAVLLAVPVAAAAGAHEDERRQAWALCGGLVAATLIAVRAVSTGG